MELAGKILKVGHVLYTGQQHWCVCAVKEDGVECCTQAKEHGTVSFSKRDIDTFFRWANKRDYLCKLGEVKSVETSYDPDIITIEYTNGNRIVGGNNAEAFEVNGKV